MSEMLIPITIPLSESDIERLDSVVANGNTEIRWRFYTDGGDVVEITFVKEM